MERNFRPERIQTYFVHNGQKSSIRTVEGLVRIVLKSL